MSLTFDSVPLTSSRRASRTWSLNSFASGEANNILQSWDIIHASTQEDLVDDLSRHQPPHAHVPDKESIGIRSQSTRRTQSKLTKRAQSIIEAVEQGNTTAAKFDASAVRNINKTYKKAVSGVGQKESFLQKLLTRNVTRRVSIRSRSDRNRASTGVDALSEASTEDEVSIYSTAKPTNAHVVQTLAPFIPRMLQTSLLEVFSEDTSLRAFSKPCMAVVCGAVMVVDVSGFTRLTEQLGKQGSSGIEMLTLVINNYLTKAIEIVTEYDGDVIKFAGDSLIVAFYGEEALLVEEEFKMVILRALQCAEDLLTKLGRVQMSANGDIRPSVKSSAATAAATRFRDPFSWIHESRKSKAHSVLSRQSQPSRKNPSSTRKSLDPSSQTSLSRPVSKSSTSTKEQEHIVAPPKSENSANLTVENEKSSCPFLERLFGLIKRRRLNNHNHDGEGGDFEHGLPDELASQLASGGGLSPRTPEKSDRLLNRGSTFWRESLTSKRSSTTTSGFRNILEEEGMSLKVLVGCGDYCMFRVGGGAEDDSGSSTTTSQQLRRWEYIIADKPNESEVELFGHQFRQPLSQIAAIESFAGEGDVIVSLEVLKIADQGFEYESLDGAARITGQMFRSKLKPRSLVSQSSPLSSLPSKQRRKFADVLRCHVIGNIRQKIEAGHLDYLSEVRRLSVLFFGFPGLTTADPNRAQEPLTHVQKTIEVLQHWMKEFEGSFVQFRCDEKGFLAICAFGLAGSNHADNGSRAISAAFKITHNLHTFGIDACVGVTSGDLLCACIGSKTRAEYTLFGHAVNLSARLMCKAKKGMGTILCDAHTQQKARSKAQFQPVEEVKLKGLEKPILIYLVSPLPFGRHRHASEMKGPAIPLIGRQHYLHDLLEKAGKAIQGEATRAVVIKGEAGIGKTKLMTEFQLSFFRERPECLSRVFHTIGDSESKSIPLYSWRRVYENLFAYDRAQGWITTAATTKNDQETPLGHILATKIANYSSTWRGFLAAALEMELEQMPSCAIPLSSFASLDSDTVEKRELDSSQSTTTSTHITGSRKALSGDLKELAIVQDGSLLSGNTPDVWHTNPCASTKEDRLMPLSCTSRLSKSQSAPRRRSTFDFSTLDRRKIILQYLVLIFQNFIELYGPSIILLEDMHHLDTLSWELVNAVMAKISHGFLLITSIRPHEGSLAPENLRIKGRKTVFEKSTFALQTLLNCPSVDVMEMRPFDLETTKEFVFILSRDALVSDSVVQYIYSKSNGIPLYVEQITAYLREQKLLESVVVGSALNSNDGLMSFIRENITIHQMLLDKIDQLRPITHLTLKVGMHAYHPGGVHLGQFSWQVASVIGKNITVELLEVVYPFVVSQKAIKESLRELVEAGFLSEVVSGNNWKFRSMLDRDSVNDVVPQSQRRLLHAKVATALSSEDHSKASQMQSRYSIGQVPSTTIAYHWSQSCLGCEELDQEKVLRAIEWWQKSANEAYEKRAFVEALRLYQKAIDYANFLNVNTDRPKIDKKWRWFGNIGLMKRLKSTSSTKVQDLHSFLVTPELKATWERRIAQLYLIVEPQTQSLELSADIKHDAAFHALEALRYLNIPMPHSRKLRHRSYFPTFLSALHKALFSKEENSLSMKRREEISQLLELLVESDDSYIAYVSVVREQFSLEDRRGGDARE